LTDTPITQPDYEIEYYPNKPLAQTVANRLQTKYQEQGCYSAAAQFEPNKGFMVVLYSERNIPEAWAEGAEVVQPHILPTRGTDPDWAKKKEKKSTVKLDGIEPSSAPSAPKGGVTAQVWAIADHVYGDGPLDRGAIIDACLAAGINKATAGTQYSKWKRARGIS
jgi:hypothetical protein